MEGIVEDVITKLNDLAVSANIDITEEVRAVIGECTRVTWHMIRQVLNNGYYPMLTTECQMYLTERYMIYLVINALYYYAKDKTELQVKQRQLEKEIESYCVEHCLLYIMDNDSLTQNVVRYLLETFLNIH